MRQDVLSARHGDARGPRGAKSKYVLCPKDRQVAKMLFPRCKSCRGIAKVAGSFGAQKQRGLPRPIGPRFAP